MDQDKLMKSIFSPETETKKININGMNITVSVDKGYELTDDDYDEIADAIIELNKCKQELS